MKSKLLFLGGLFTAIGSGIIFLPLVQFPKKECQSNTSQITIEAYKCNQDAEILTDLMKEYWNVLAPGNEYNPAIVNATLNDQVSVTFYPKKITIKVLKVENKVVGFITYLLCADHIGHIELLAVDHSAHRHGNGTLLVQHAINDLQAMGATAINICVVESNNKAQALYHKFGFKIAQQFKENNVLLLSKEITA